MATDASSRPSPDEALAAAYAALDGGHEQAARGIVQSVLKGAQGLDLHVEARALACLAHCDRVTSRLRRAAETSRRAAQLFEQLGDVQGEANALTTLAHVCMLLGRNAEAVEAALLCVRLCEKLPTQAQTVLAHNCLGLACSWSGDHDRGDASLELAVQAARRCVPPVSIYQPRLNQAWIEASRRLDERYQTGRISSLARMESLMHECRELEFDGNGLAVLPGLQSMARTISLASTGLLATWQGDLEGGKRAFDAAARSLSGTMTWLDSFVRWCAAELAWAQQDWAAAERELIEMREMALAVEHEQMACRAHLLLAQVFELQGKHAQAQREHRALRRREQRVVCEGTHSRESMVAWQLGARQSERHLQQALVVSKQFERWSLEDALTGLANRRHVEQQLGERLQALQPEPSPLTIAMVDIDKFKAVNDRFTHSVGDRVLKTVAALMASQVRDHDLPARWAGDEFVILFADATEQEAQPVCERIREAISGFDWESIASGLRVTVSIGLGEARAGDTVESALHRSDTSMYREKAVESTHA